MLRPIKRFKGHQNTCKNFIRAGFAGDSLVLGGSEDGIVYIWDTMQGNLVEQMSGHGGIVYDAVWNNRQSLLASCSEDGTIKTWWYAPEQQQAVEQY